MIIGQFYSTKLSDIYLEVKLIESKAKCKICKQMLFYNTSPHHLYFLQLFIISVPKNILFDSIP